MPESSVFSRRALILGAAGACAAGAEARVLVYTRNYTPDGKGYVHDNIWASVEALRKMGREAGFAVEAADQPRIFEGGRLKQYRAIVFSNSNNEAFEDDGQRAALQEYVRGGGGVVGIHSATGSERKWPWYWAMMGGKFLRHPKMQTFTVRVKDAGHRSARALPATFEWTDECYYHDNLNPDIRAVLVTDPAKLDDPKKAEYPGDRFGDALPLAWWHEFEGGRVFYTGLGHKPEHYQDGRLTAHILGGLEWAMGGQ